MAVAPATIPAGQRVVWSTASSTFELQPALRDVQSTGTTRTVAVSDAPFASLEHAMQALDDAMRNGDALSKQTLERVLATRVRATQQLEVLAGERDFVVAMRALVSHWHALLTRCSEHVITSAAVAVASDGINDSERATTALAREYLELANTLRRMGDITAARASLGKCIVLVRQRHDAKATALLRTATRALAACIAFEALHTKCWSLLQRHTPPSHILAFLARELEALSAQAPLALDVLMRKTDVQWRAHQFAPIASSLAASPLTRTSAPLTLMYVRALERLGRYQQSLDVVLMSDWSEPQSVNTSSSTMSSAADDDDASVSALRAHQQRLELLFAHKRTGEQQTRAERFVDAASSYAQCLALLGDCERPRCSFTATLLFARANAVLLALAEPAAVVVPPTAASAPPMTRTRQLASAIQDLQRSLDLEPSNPLTRLRLDTALLAHETEMLQVKLK